MTSFTAVSCHFGSDFWIKQLIGSLIHDKFISEIVIGHFFHPSDLTYQLTDRVKPESISKVTLIEKISEDKPPHPSEAHAEMLMHILKNHQFSTEYVLVLDSDMVVLDNIWTKNLSEKMVGFDAILAISHREKSQTHPCLMAFHKDLIPQINLHPFHIRAQYDRKQKEFREDTGVSIGSQLLKSGYKVRFTEPTSLYGGRFFHKYLEGQIAHIGSQSLKSIFNSKNEKLGPFASSLHYEIPKFFVAKLSKKPEWAFKSPPYLYLVLSYLLNNRSKDMIKMLMTYVLKKQNQKFRRLRNRLNAKGI